MTLNCVSCLYFSVLSSSCLNSLGNSNYPGSTIAASDVMSESMVETNDPILGSGKGDSGAAPEMDDDKLCLKMKLVSPETEGSEESLQFSLESKFLFYVNIG